MKLVAFMSLLAGLLVKLSWHPISCLRVKQQGHKCTAGWAGPRVLDVSRTITKVKLVIEVRQSFLLSAAKSPRKRNLSTDHHGRRRREADRCADPGV